MKLIRWKELIIIDLDKIKNWTDVDVALAYYLKDAQDMVKRNKADRSKRKPLVWWHGLTTNERKKIIESAYKKRGKKK